MLSEFRDGELHFPNSQEEVIEQYSSTLPGSCSINQNGECMDGNPSQNYSVYSNHRYDYGPPYKPPSRYEDASHDTPPLAQDYTQPMNSTRYNTYNEPSCLECVNHIESCKLCSKVHAPKSNTVYILIIIVLLILCIYLVKKLTDKGRTI